MPETWPFIKYSFIYEKQWRFLVQGHFLTPKSGHAWVRKEVSKSKKAKNGWVKKTTFANFNKMENPQTHVQIWSCRNPWFQKRQKRTHFYPTRFLTFCRNSCFLSLFGMIPSFRETPFSKWKKRLLRNGPFWGSQKPSLAKTAFSGKPFSRDHIKVACSFEFTLSRFKIRANGFVKRGLDMHGLGKPFHDLGSGTPQNGGSGPNRPQKGPFWGSETLFLLFWNGSTSVQKWDPGWPWVSKINKNVVADLLKSTSTVMTVRVIWAVLGVFRPPKMTHMDRNDLLFADLPDPISSSQPL